MSEVAAGITHAKEPEDSKAVPHANSLLEELTRRLALADGDNFASMGVLMGHDARRLVGRYSRQLNRLLASMISREPKLAEKLSTDSNRAVLNFSEANLQDKFMEHARLPKFPSFYEQSTQIYLFYKRLAPMECSLRFLQNYRRFISHALPFNEIDITSGHFAEYIGKEVGLDFQLSVVLSEISEPDFPKRPLFERLFICSFRLLLETRNYDHTRKYFLSHTKINWPNVPAYGDEDALKRIQDPDDRLCAAIANDLVKYARASLAQCPKAEHAAFALHTRPEPRLLVETIVFCFFFLKEKIEATPSRDITHPQDEYKKSIARLSAPARNVYTELVDLLWTTDLLRH